MSPEQKTSAKRLTMHESWTWTEGMLVIYYVRGSAYERARLDRQGALRLSGLARSGALPDLEDPATQGILLARLIELVGFVSVGNMPESLGNLDGATYWEIGLPNDDDITAPTLGQALAMAIDHVLMKRSMQ